MNLKLRKIRPLFLSLVCLVMLLALGASTAFGLAAIVVDPTNLNGWSFALDSAFTTVKGNFMPGPGTAPLGLGSAHLAVTDAGGAGQVVLKTDQFKGTLLSQIVSINYWTYVSSTSSVAPSFQMVVDYDTTDSDTSDQGRLVYDPLAVTPGVWQSRTPTGGSWRSDTKTQLQLCGFETCTWELILEAWHNAGIWNDDTGLVLFKAGGSTAWANFDGNVDNFTIILADATSFDFEPPAEVFVDDDWAAKPLWKDPNGDEPPFYMGLDGFTSIQDAVDVVQVGGTVNVAAGTYENTGQITIHKTLALVGEDKATTILKPLSDIIGSEDLGAWIVVNDGVTFDLSGVTLDGTGWQIRQGLRFNGGGSVDDVIIQHIKAAGYMGFAIVQGYFNTTPRTLTVTNSTITDFGRVGIQADAGSGESEVIISNNIITGKGEGDHLDYGVTVEGGASATITGNTITNCLGVALIDGSTSAAISASTYFASGTSAVITGNTLMNNSYAIAVGFDGTDTSSVTAQFNHIFNNGTGIASSAPAVLAENNWWGCNEGPAGADCDQVDGSVDANPWLVMNVSTLPAPLIPGSTFTFTADLTDNSDGVDTTTQGLLPNGILINFTPTLQVNPDSAALASGVVSTQATMPVTPTTFDLCAVLDNETTCRGVEITQPTHTWADDGWIGLANGTLVNWGTGDHFVGYDAFAAVQPAVNAVAAGGTVTVRPGTYLEQVSLIKSLTLTGETDQLLTTTIKAPAVNPVSDIVLVSGTGVNVEITGLTISGPGAATGGSLGTGIFVRSGANANIHHNRVLEIRDSTLSSALTGIAIQVGSQTLSTTGTATIAYNTISGYQRSGIAVNLAGSSATINNNTIVGAGPTSVIAQRGILVSYGATANITANTVSAHSYLGAGGSAIGILLYGSSANTSGNTLNENFYGIYQLGGSGTHDGNTLSATAAGVGASSYYGISISNDQAAAPMTVTVSNNDLNGNLAGYPGISVFGGYTTHNISLTARNNYLRNWQQGITTSCLPPGCPTSGYPIVLAEKNSITTSSTYALALYTVPGVVDARLNWWGSNTGPTYADNPGGAGGVISAASGAVTFSPWLCSATDTQAAIGFQPDLNVKCGLAAKLAFTTQPGGALINQPLTPQPAVVAQDADGNPAINFTGAVTAAIGANPSTGTLAGALTKAALNGLATFTDLSIDRAGVGYTLSAASTDLTSAVSSAFTISNPVPALTAISPTWIRHGSEFVVITLTGTGFAYNAEARWNGVPLGINEQNSTMIRAYVPGALLADLSSVNITAFNPTPDGGTSGAKTFSIVNETNISMTKTDGLNSVKGGETVTYTVVVSNAGPDPLTGGTLSDPIPAVLTGVTWSCVATGTGSLCTASGSGNTLLDTVNIAVGGSVTYTITGSLPNQVSGLLTNTATLTLPALYADTDGLGLTATDTTLLGANFNFYLPIVVK